MKRRLMTLAVLGVLFLTITFSSAPTAKCVDKFCSSCQTTCEQDYLEVLANCMSDGTSVLVCQIRNSSWMHNCGVVMCPVCPWYENY
jgi:hypothetical protein